MAYLYAYLSLSTPPTRYAYATYGVLTCLIHYKPVLTGVESVVK